MMMGLHVGFRMSIVTLLAVIAPVGATQITPPIRVQPGRTLTPIQVSPIQKSNPTVIVLVHGATNDPAVAGDPKPGTLDNTKAYWGYGLVSELIGAYIQRPEDMVPQPPSMQIPTPSSAQLARRIKSLGGSPMSAGQWESFSNSEANVNHHFYVPGNSTANPPNFALLMTYRDASKRLVPQARTFVDQVFEKINAIYPNTKPNLIIVGHSMGGLLARYVLTPPNDPISGESLTQVQKDRAKWIRDRTLYVVTLATPHEGSPLAAKFEGIRNFIQSKTAFIKPVLEMVGFQNPNPVGLITNVLGVTQALSHLRVDFWQGMNTGQLSPFKMARSDGSHIPIYAMGGRTPGGSFFDNLEDYPQGDIKIDSSMDRDKKAIGLMMLDWGLRNAPGSPTGWGPLHSAAGFDLDKVERGNFQLLPPPKTHRSPPYKLPAANLESLPFFYLWNRDDQETDTDGMVPIQSALGFRLGGNANRPFDHDYTYPVGGKSVRGSWYRYNSGPWDRTNHDSICFRPTVGQWIFENLIGKAGPSPASGPVSVWP